MAMATFLSTAHAASYTVGAPAGSWGLGTNYTLWSAGVTFRAGDQLVFKYAGGAHDVLEVTKADHDACSTSNPLATFATGDDVVTLVPGGVTRYFICGVPGHCAAGMKLAVTVVVGAASPSPSPAPVAMAPRAAARPPVTTVAAHPSPAPVAMAPRAGRPAMATPAGARAQAAGGLPAAVSPSSSAAAEDGVGRSLVGLALGAAVAALMALY
ncbi:hypothetical protein HU200_028603 [Digitaria exilis]|uniref:Phytocyanin domain-containing protein n=1 Tax=Digitaria exilis TaxID=1010633 RepID=A0A835BS63_9POAL|nr:hypothetical protein HU200_028603 [Digitaria exilis]